MTSDSALLRQFWAEKDQAAFQQLVERHLSAVYFAALRLVAGDAHLAQDISQEVFTALAQKAQVLSSRQSVAGWLYTASRFEAARAVREAQRRRAREKAALPEVLSPEQVQAEWEQLRPIIDEVLNSLAEIDREVVLQRFFYGRDYAAIGAQMGKTADAIRFRVDRALQKMKRGLRRRGVDSSATAIALALASQADAMVPAAVAQRIQAATLLQFTQAASAPAAVAASTMGWFGLGTLVSGIAAGIALIAAGFAVHEHRLSAAVIAANAAALNEYQMTLRDLARWRHEVQVNPPMPDRTQAADVKARAGTGRSSGMRPFAATQQAVNKALASDPEIRRDFAANGKAVFMEAYGPALRAHGLTAAQIDQFAAAFTQLGPMAMSGIQLSLRPNSVSTSEAAQAVQQSLAGKVTWETLTESNAQYHLEAMVTGLAGALSDSAMPLSADQSTEGECPRHGQRTIGRSGVCSLADGPSSVAVISFRFSIRGLARSSCSSRCRS